MDNWNASKTRILGVDAERGRFAPRQLTERCDRREIAAKAPLGTPVVNPIPVSAGIELKPEHYGAIVDDQPNVGWFEVRAEEYMEAGGPPHHCLRKIRENYPLSIHGVGMSIGSHGPLDKTHLKRLKALCDRYQPGLVSEHLGWSIHDGVYLNELLPLPYNHRTLQHVCEHIDEIQTALGQQILLENPCAHLRFQNSDINEIEFLSGVVQLTGCGLLLDLNNVQASESNDAIPGDAYVDSFPMHYVGEIHVGCPALGRDETCEVLIDVSSGSSDICNSAWQHYQRALARAGAKPTLIEFGSDVPAWSVAYALACRVDRLLSSRGKDDDRAA